MRYNVNVSFTSMWVPFSDISDFIVLSGRLFKVWQSFPGLIKELQFNLAKSLFYFFIKRFHFCPGLMSQKGNIKISGDHLIDGQSEMSKLTMVYAKNCITSLAASLHSLSKPDWILIWQQIRILIWYIGLFYFFLPN